MSAKLWEATAPLVMLFKYPKPVECFIAKQAAIRTLYMTARSMNVLMSQRPSTYHSTSELHPVHMIQTK